MQWARMRGGDRRATCSLYIMYLVYTIVVKLSSPGCLFAAPHWTRCSMHKTAKGKFLYCMKNAKLYKEMNCCFFSICRWLAIVAEHVAFASEKFFQACTRSYRTLSVKSREYVCRYLSSLVNVHYFVDIVVRCRRTLKLSRDKFGNIPTTSCLTSRSGLNNAQRELFDILDNLESMGHQLLGLSARLLMFCYKRIFPLRPFS